MSHQDQLPQSPVAPPPAKRSVVAAGAVVFLGLVALGGVGSGIYVLAAGRARDQGVGITLIICGLVLAGMAAWLWLHPQSRPRTAAEKKRGRASLVAVIVGFILYRICAAFMEFPSAALLGVLAGAATWLMIRPKTKDAP